MLGGGAPGGCSAAAAAAAPPVPAPSAAAGAAPAACGSRSASAGILVGSKMLLETLETSTSYSSWLMRRSMSDMLSETSMSGTIDAEPTSLLRSSTRSEMPSLISGDPRAPPAATMKLEPFSAIAIASYTTAPPSMPARSGLPLYLHIMLLTPSSPSCTSMKSSLSVCAGTRIVGDSSVMSSSTASNASAASAATGADAPGPAAVAAAAAAGASSPAGPVSSIAKMYSSISLTKNRWRYTMRICEILLRKALEKPVRRLSSAVYVVNSSSTSDLASGLSRSTTHWYRCSLSTLPSHTRRLPSDAFARMRESSTSTVTWRCCRESTAKLEASS